MDEDHLIARAQQGEQEAVDELIRRHYHASLRIACAILRNQHDAEDVVQSAYCKAIEHLRDFRRESRFGSWMTRIVINNSIGLIRSRRSRQTRLEDVARGTAFTSFIVPQSTPEEIAAAGEAALLLKEAVANLPPLQRHPCQLRLQGLTVSDISTRMHVDVSTVRVRQHRAVRALRFHLQRRIGRLRVQARSLRGAS